MKRRIVSLLALTTMTATMFAGCGGAASNDAEPATDTAATETEATEAE